MILTGSASLIAKRALGAKCFQASMQKIIDFLPLDPAVTQAEGVILTEQDFAGPHRKNLEAALKSRHPKTAVVYLYKEDKQADFALTPYKKKITFLTPAAVTEAVTEFMGQHEVKAFEQKYVSADDRTIESKFVPEPVKPPAPEPDTREHTQPPQTLDIPEAVPPYAAKSYAAPAHRPSIEEMLDSIAGFEDWDMFKRSLERETVTRKLIEENTEYQGLLTMLDVFDLRIREVFADKSLSAEQRRIAIQKFGLDRTALKESAHSIYTEKLIRIMNAVTDAANRAVNERINEIEDALRTLVADKDVYLKGDKIHELSQKRVEMLSEMLVMTRGLIDTYKAMDNAVTEEMNSFDKDLPTSNALISVMMAPLKHVFLPKNAPGLGNKLMRALQEKRVSLSAIEDRIDMMMNLVFKCMEADEEIITYQQHVIEILKANRVEDVVIADSLIKEILRLFIGCGNSGRTSTAMTYAGVMSRKQNTLVIDLSHNSKLEQYGIKPVSVNEFLSEHIERELLFVADNSPYDPEMPASLVADVRERIGYYACVIVILDDTQIEALNQLSRDALSVVYITNCTVQSLEATKNVIAKHTADNIARKLAVIDPALPLTEIVESVGADMMSTKVMPIPYIKAIRRFSLTNKPPYEDEDVRRIYAEALK